MSHQTEGWNGLSLRHQIENAQSTAEDARETANAANDNVQECLGGVETLSEELKILTPRLESLVCGLREAGNYD